MLPDVFEKCPVSTEQINLAATSAMMLLDQHSRAIWAIAGGTGKSRIILLAAIAIVTKLHELKDSGCVHILVPNDNLMQRDKTELAPLLQLLD